LLLAAGADVNARDEDASTALQLAIRKGDKPLAEFLRGKGGKE